MHRAAGAAPLLREGAAQRRGANDLDLGQRGGRCGRMGPRAGPRCRSTAGGGAFKPNDGPGDCGPPRCRTGSDGRRHDLGHARASCVPAKRPILHGRRRCLCRRLRRFRTRCQLPGRITTCDRGGRHFPRSGRSGRSGRQRRGLERVGRRVVVDRTPAGIPAAFRPPCEWTNGPRRLHCSKSGRWIRLLLDGCRRTWLAPGDRHQRRRHPLGGTDSADRPAPWPCH